MGNTNCRAEAAGPVGTKCAGKTTCTLNGNNDDFTNPCPGVHKYLKVVYQCVDAKNLAQTDPLNDPNAVQQTDAPTHILTSPVVLTILVISLVVVGLVVTIILYYAVTWCKNEKIEREAVP